MHVHVCVCTLVCVHVWRREWEGQMEGERKSGRNWECRDGQMRREVEMNAGDRDSLFTKLITVADEIVVISGEETVLRPRRVPRGASWSKALIRTRPV